jgi:hypothetical protein
MYTVYVQQESALAAHDDEAPTRKNYRLLQSKLDAARRVLGTRTETETIERALDLVAFGERLAAGTRRVRGRSWHDVFGELTESASE